MTRTRVLIAEDQTLIRLDLHRLLESAGYDVCGLAVDGSASSRPGAGSGAGGFDGHPGRRGR